jgi:hypothetical protein
LGETAAERFRSDFRHFQLSSADEIEASARSVTAGLEANPAGLGTLRAGKLLLDGVAIALALWAGAFEWPTLLYIPLFVSLGHQLVELFVRQYVEGRRASVRTHKMTTVTEKISTPLADWLTQWPATGGSAYEKLQSILRRIPETITRLQALADEKQPR